MLGGASAGSAASLDPTFGDEGTVITGSGHPVLAPGLNGVFTGMAWDLIEDSEGRLLAGGSSEHDLFVARYLNNGESDPGFGTGGKSIFDVNLPYPEDYTSVPVRALALDPAGGILVGAKIWGVKRVLRSLESQYFRLLSDGSIDPSFGPRPGFAGYNQSTPRDMVLRPGGGFFVAGSAHGQIGLSGAGPTKRAGFVRAFRADGRPDLSFGNKGIVKLWTGKAPYFAAFESIRRLKSGKLLVSGYHRDRMLLGRLLPNGRWDKRFGDRGTGYTLLEPRKPDGSVCFCTFGAGISIDGKGRIYQGGYSAPSRTSSTQRFLNVVRYLPNGRIDRSYGKRGRSVLDVGTRVLGGDVSVLPSGRAYVAAWVGPAPATKFTVFAFLPNGKPDRSFFDNGRYQDVIGPASVANKTLIDSQGRLVVAGGTNLNDEGSFVLKRFLVP